MKTTPSLAFRILITFFALTTSTLLAQPIINAVRPTNANSQLRFDVTGGSGSFAVERANLANDPWCSIAAVNQRSNEPGGTPVPSAGTGFGYVGLLGRQFSVGMHYRDLTGAASLAHLHGPGTTNQSVGVQIDFNNASYNAGGLGITGFLLGSATTTDAIASYLVDFLTYVNIHTAANGGGEIRGQVMP